MVHTATKEVAMNVVIGVDPQKASHTAVAIDEAEDEISSIKVRATVVRSNSSCAGPGDSSARFAPDP